MSAETLADNEPLGVGRSKSHWGRPATGTPADGGGEWVTLDALADQAFQQLQTRWAEIVDAVERI